MHRGSKRPDDPTESVTDRLRRLDAALQDVRKQAAKVAGDTQRLRAELSQTRAALRKKPP